MAACNTAFRLLANMWQVAVIAPVGFALEMKQTPELLQAKLRLLLVGRGLARLLPLGVAMARPLDLALALALFGPSDLDLDLPWGFSILSRTAFGS